MWGCIEAIEQVNKQLRINLLQKLNPKFEKRT